ncbi:MAG: hypothetical protein R3C01_00630 [Planctomycetaceae bacterium]
MEWIPDALGMVLCRRLADRSRPPVRLWNLLLMTPLWIAFLGGELLLTETLRADGDEPQAAIHRDAMDTPRTSWRVSSSTKNVQLGAHRRNPRVKVEGLSAEEVQVSVHGEGGRLYMEYDSPHALVIDDLTVSVKVRSSRSGVRLGVRLVFPNEVNPHDGTPLTADFLGDAYSTALRWQTLTCQTTAVQLRQLVGRKQAQLAQLSGARTLDTRGLYVDRILLIDELSSGGAEYFIDDLELGPIVEPSKNGTEIVQQGHTVEQQAPVTIGDDRILLHGAPFFPLIVPYHGEDLEQIRRLGVNVVWLPELDQPVLQAIGDIGLGAMATPPAADVLPASGTDLDVGTRSYSVGLPLFSRETSPILFWCLGTRYPEDGLTQLKATADAVRDADPYRRPLLVDVMGSEREFHRRVDVISMSKHIPHTSTSPLAYVEHLERAQLMALHGKPTSTWIATEASQANIENRPPDARVPIVEAEQLWMQTWAAIGAGVKGIGFWKNTPFNDDQLGSDERRHAITIASLQIHLLRKWIATGRIVDQAPIQIGEAPSRSGNLLTSALTTRWNRVAGEEEPKSGPLAEIRVPVLRSELGWLILPTWHEENAQYQPGPMSVNDLRIFLRGFDGLQAWEVTTTSIQPCELALDPPPGGSELRLKTFDQTTAILVTSDMALIEEIRREILSVRAQAAQAYVDLAKSRLDRVRDTHAELQQLARRGVPNGDQILDAARRHLKQAEQELQQEHFDAARIASRHVLMLCRSLQRAHWQEAASEVSSPTSTPYTISFQTLPDYWKLRQRIDAQSGQRAEPIRGGNFEDWDTILAAGWQEPPELKGKQVRLDHEVRVEANLDPRAAEGVYSLRMAASPANPADPPVVCTKSSFRFDSPGVPVYAGEVVKIRGKLWFNQSPSRHVDGLMIYDSLSGTVGAIRYHESTPTGQWLPFELIRPVQRSGQVRITFELRGLGDVLIDDLQVSRIAP